ncbi:hypothetical protein [Aeromicrobium sp. CTD01-1L150]|uniref:hypothetical protein n=1 Tax=Aeromicrobium sp. CTD01-1L150 TaxID=3341830 RepID=UPI0035C1BDC0
MNKTRAVAVAFVVLFIAAAGVLGLRSWVGIEAGEDLVGSTSTSAPSDAQSPDPQEPQETADPTPTSSNTPSPEPTLEDHHDSDRDGEGLASPSGIAADIEARLNQSGPRTSVSCPQAVSTAVGTTFSCSVAYADRPHEAVADAQVNIVGSGLRYVWRSTPR